MLSCLKVRCHSSYAMYMCMRIELTLERMSTLLLRPFPKNGSLSRNLIGLKSFGLFTKISGLLPVKPSRASGIPRTLKEIHWSVITIGILRNGNLKNSSFPKSGIKDCSLFYFALCIVHKSNYSLFNEVKIFIKVKLGNLLSLSIEVFIVLLLEFVCQ